jgi:NAD(P)-dependent dehydrogenase (short-subunit alcohol dehydrogenase family)
LDKEEDAKNLIDMTIKNCGQLDILVNNAAQFDCGSNIEEPNAIEVYDKVMRTNLRNAFQLTHYVILNLIPIK